MLYSINITTESSLFGSITKTLETGLNNVVHEIDKGLKVVIPDKRLSEDRFTRHFGFPPTEGLYWGTHIVAMFNNFD